MAPIRRYLRITAYSVLEVRIYLDNPADAHRWLLHSSDPALPRIISTIRPLVLPKLREENERSKKGGKKRGGVKDTISGEDFEVSIFLTDLSTSHSLLSKSKVFGEKKETKLKSQRKSDGSAGTGGGAGARVGRQAGSKSKPMEIDADDDNDEDDDDENSAEPTTIPNLLREESDDTSPMNLEAIPLVGSNSGSKSNTNSNSTSKPVNIDDDDDNHSDNSDTSTTNPKEANFNKNDDDKKKLGFATTYDGFRIYGKILCLVVKRKGKGTGASGGGGGRGGQQQQLQQQQLGVGGMAGGSVGGGGGGGGSGGGGGGSVMENWIASTQEPPPVLMED